VSNQIVIVGAGPYGLSIAAHLRARGVGFRIFGRPMFNWQAKMPRGMKLKSEGFASNLAAPAGAGTLEDFCAERGLPYAAEAYPVPREDFIAYGQTFQQRFVPEVEKRMVVSVRRSGDAFAVQLEDGEIVAADKVVIGVGISDFPHVPPALAGLSAEFVSHSSHHEDMAAFRGRDVAVIGGGSSAIDIAALLHENGAAVQLVTRRPELPFHSPPDECRSPIDRVRAPQTGIGPGWRSFFYTEAPLLFHRLPADLRWRIVSTWLGPAGGWYMRERVEGKVASLLGWAPQEAEIDGGKVRLRLTGTDGSERTLAVDHVLAATGYRVDVQKIGFLDEALRAEVSTASGFPVLSRDFESSVAGLYFVGPAAALSFGPMFRFVLGARYTARRLAGRLARAGIGRPVVRRPALATR
jgi:cation diffusion facilitator CzcD-associated flavoprotein CzcO